MPIDSTTTIVRLILTADITAIGQAKAASSYRGRGPNVPVLATGDYDVNDPEVAEVISRVRNGLEVVYSIQDSALSSRLGRTGREFFWVYDHELPEAYHQIRDTHPFHPNYVAEDKSRGPYVDVFYQRATTAPANTTVQFTGIESVGGFERRVENTGWLQTPPTGTDTLWYSVVRYGVYTDGEGWTDVEVARDTDINWSTDFGATWLSDLPADYDDVTDVRVRYGTIWTDIPVFVDPDTNSPWLTLSVHNDIVPLPADGLIALEIAGAALADLYQVGVRMDVYANDGRIIRSGEAWISTDYGRRSNVHPFGLQFIPPEDLDELLPVAPYRYIVQQDNMTGEVQLFHGDVFVFQLPTTVSAAYLSFGGFPVTTIAEAMGDGMDITSFLAVNPNVGFKIGDTLFIDDEQMRINSTNIVPFSPRVNVDRAINGTTRAAHDNGSLVRGVVREDVLHNVHVWDQHNTLPVRTRLSVLGLRRVD